MGKKTNKSQKKSQKLNNKAGTSKSLSNLFPSVIPLGSRVLIRPFTKGEIETKSNFGIILPDSDSKEKSEQGVVLVVGFGEYKDGKLVHPVVKAGDKVIFSKYGYEDITVDGEELYLIKEENILAILK